MSVRILSPFVTSLDESLVTSVGAYTQSPSRQRSGLAADAASAAVSGTPSALRNWKNSSRGSKMLTNDL